MKYIKNTLANIRKEPDQFLLMTMMLVLPLERIPSFDALGITWRLSLVVGGLIILRTVYLMYRKKLSFKLITPYKILAIFLIWMVLVIPISINLSRAVMVFVFSTYAIVLSVSISLLYKNKYLQPMLVALLAGAVITCLFGLYQYFGDIFGLSVQYTGLRERYTYALFGFPRVQSTGLEPLYFASYLLLPTSILASIFLTKAKLIHLNTRSSIAIFSLFCLLIFLTVSRGAIYGLIAMMLSMVMFLLFKKITTLKRVIAIFLAIIVGFGLSWLLINHLNTNPSQYFTQKKGAEVYTEQITNTTFNDAGDERAKARQNAINLIKQQKLAVTVGIGPGQYGPYMMNNQPDENGWTIVNNQPLELLLELGIVGLIIFATFVIYIFIQGLRLVPLKDPIVSATLIGLLGYLVAEAIQYQSFSTLYITHIWVAIGLLIGITRLDSEKSK